MQRGDYTRAIAAYRAYLQQPTDDTYVPRAWYRIALSQYRLQDHHAALATVDELFARYPSGTWPQAHALRGDAHLALEHRVSALQAWAEAWRIAEAADRPALRARFDRTIEILTPTERLRAKEVITDATIRTWLERPPAGAPSTATGAPETGSAGASAPGSARIACLLPLSGQYRVFGERSLEGIRLALGDDSERLLVKDTAGDADTARDAFAEMAARSDVVAVIGPLRSDVAADLAPRAEAAGLPLILLAPREGLTGPFVLQTAMTRAQQADLLATHALQVHWRHFGILAPDDGYGKAFAEKFRAAIEGRGGRVTWTEFYEPRQRDVAAPIARARERHTQGVLDAIFLPDSAAAMITVGAAVRAAMPDIGLLGPNEWNDPATLRSAGAALDGALLVTGFFADSARPATRAFVDAFRTLHGAAPEIWAAQAYDAAVVLRAALQRGATTRDALIETLRHLDRVPGATGEIRMSDTNPTRMLFLVRLTGGRLEEVETPRPAD